MDVMKRLLLAFVMLSCISAFGQENGFTQAVLDRDGERLWLRRADGSKAAAPMLEDQDAFEAPAVASDRRHAGWLALFPDHGASYSQPLYLVVMDTSNHLQRFRSDFGLVFKWCFTPGGKEVVFQSAFPHGPTPVEFEMRRISDGRLLRRFTLPENYPRDDSDTPHKPIPSWVNCTRRSSR
jgi:hypothetical protein